MTRQRAGIVNRHRPSWPSEPYKGLGCLTEGDEPLLVGRDNEVAAFLRILTAPRTRVVVLHGQSGCGKTSFLRAGVFPALVSSARWRLPLAPTALEPLIARAGTRPLAAIAAALYDLVEQQRPTVLGTANRLLRCRSRSSFVHRTAADPEELTRALGIATVAVPYKLCLVLDQLEEVLASRANDVARTELYHLGRLLQSLATRHSVLHLVLAMRTEYKGRFDDLMEAFGVDRDLVYGYALDPLDRTSLVEAILRPTKTKSVTSGSGTEYPAPIDSYQFRYEAGLVDSIVGEVCAGHVAGPQLLAIQMLCQRLYTYARDGRAKARRPKTLRITTADYRDVGGSRDIIRSFLADAVRTALSTVRLESDDKDILTDSVWSALLTLVFTEQDGRVTSVPTRHSDLIRHLPWALRGSRATKLLELLSSEPWMVLRRERDPQRRGQDAWRLGHDALGLSLVRWQSQRRIIEWERDTQQSHPTVTAARLAAMDLWGSAPQSTTIMTLDDHIWDHQLPLYAQSQGFLSRLGFSLETRDQGGNEFTFAAWLKKIRPFPQENDQLWAMPLPRALAGTDSTWSDFHIWNLYDGFCVIGGDTHDRAVLDCGIGERWHELTRLVRDMSRRRVLAYDQQGAAFIRSLAKLVHVGAPEVDVVGMLQRDVDLMYRYLTRGRHGRQVDYVVGPAPTRALAESVGLRTLVDHRAVMDLIEHQFRRKDADRWRHEFAKLVLHNTWQINIPPDDLFKCEHIVLPLASVGLHTAEYLQVQPQSFVDFVFQRDEAKSWQRQRLDKQAIRTAVARSYKLMGAVDLATQAYSSVSPTAYHSGTSAARVYLRMLSLRHECDTLIGALESHSAGLRDPHLQESARRGYNHYRIHNYYHAREYLKMAAAKGTH